MEKTKKIILKVLCMFILIILLLACREKGTFAVSIGDIIAITCSGCPYGGRSGRVYSITSATCTSAQKVYYSCIKCGKYGVTTAGKALGHSKYVTTYSGGSCTTNKKAKYECQRAGCSWSEWQEVAGSALGHDFSKTVMDKKGTCTERGYVIKQCSRCTATKDVTPGSSQGSAYAIQGHKYQREDVKPTCGKAGHIYNICIVWNIYQNV